ncbi:23S rRNA (pseudouridine(1915)-N(3))-methyltransferase RlmH [Rubellimicrobium sp. CFH 75288]|uniref:23S rRNA (pseudouridine(1915)-N(3))-methyltransferase RlmH n=1 Tax=Rubellimicrobium sp. CFH 75288 TaxID=2697034 RepID=UPI0014136F20|nr:23S rRNA (pseudouridine(1915)-N(3))-methyltransferase RlmH [Rubellimicrobium sp. CFH 75288]NAZ36744.1 23S rRNA (pseudouridine(1915)-N(3))-methyltransferase RlmH [Rubellimicrobium sp. CFH 75288]
MRLHVLAVGRLRAGAPERRLFDDWQARFDRTGRSVGLGPLIEREVEPKAAGAAAEAEALGRAIPPDALTVALDERGRVLSSPDFAARLAAWRDEGRTDAAFLIGGADGLRADLRDRADLVLSFGPMVWPHMLARAMLAEQIYRAATLLAGLPYHRT